MAIVQIIDFSQFCDAFRDMGRNDNFSYEGKRVLFDYLEDYSDSTGKPVELDIIALCCDYNEDSIESIVSYYRIDVSEAQGDEDAIENIARDFLEYHTSIVGEVPGGFVYACF